MTLATEKGGADLPGPNRQVGSLENTKDKVCYLEEDERTLTWMHKVDDAHLRYVERVIRDLEPKRRVRTVPMRMMGATRPDRVWDIAGIFREPVADEPKDLRRRRVDARNAVSRLEGVARQLTLRKNEIEHVRWRPDEETVRRFDAPERVRTTLTRIVEDVFAVMGGRDEASEAGDFEKVWRPLEVEKAQRA